MTAYEFINYLHRHGVNEESRLCGVKLIFANGNLSNWRVLRIDDGYVNVNDMIQFVAMRNLENHEVRLSILRKLYRSDIEIEFGVYNDIVVHIADARECE